VIEAWLQAVSIKKRRPTLSLHKLPKDPFVKSHSGHDNSMFHMRVRFNAKKASHILASLYYIKYKS
jgi:hypothetical protein